MLTFICMQVLDKDAGHPITVGKSPRLKLLNRFNNITVCKSIRNYICQGITMYWLLLQMITTGSY